MQKTPKIDEILRTKENLVKEEPQTLRVDEKLKGKSENFEKCYNALHEARHYIERNDSKKANRFYTEARDIYINLSNQEKKDIYDELMEVYNKLSK